MSLVSLDVPDGGTAPVRTHQRPPAFSDSFLVVGSPHELPSPRFDVPFSVLRPRFDCAWWSEKIISIMIHISFISLFETLFFFMFVSESEDTALLNAVGGFIGGFDAACAAESAQTEAFLRFLAGMLVNTTAVADAAAHAATERRAYNTHLERQSWTYTGALSGTTSILIALSLWKRYKIHWRRIWVENIALVGLLGVYEYLFFRTIVYNYTSLTAAELKWNLVERVNASCGIF